MSPTFNPSPTMPPSNSSSIPYMPQETESPLPGIKRGIAIGVACSVSIILVAILAFFAIRRRNRVLKRNRRARTPEVDNIEAWPQEKAWWTAPATAPSPPIPSPPSPPPVEADARTIYELEGDLIPELPNNMNLQYTERARDEEVIHENQNDVYVQKLKQWKAWSIAIEPEPTNSRPASWRLPLLTISPPEASPRDVSPLLNSAWSFDASPVIVSPPPNAHFPSRSP
jgi:hypothetical protein